MPHVRTLAPLGVAVVAFAALFAAVASADPELRAGLFGLTGTLVGALTTFGATQLSSRSELLAQKRAAARLLQEDLMFARTRCRYAQRNERFWTSRLDLRLEGWEKHSETVARNLEDPYWRSVTDAFAAMRAVQNKCDGLRTAENNRPRLGKISNDLINAYLERSEAAIEALSPLSGGRPSDETLVDDNLA